MAQPYYSDDLVTLHHGDCLDVLRTLPDACIAAVVTDPPYELGFMGKGWDSTGIAYNVDLWRECLRVLRPGGHLVAFGGTRTYHRMACAIEDAGFEIRDGMTWLYGSGFPKSLDVSKAIDKSAGAEREVIGPVRAGIIGARGGVSTNHGRGGDDSHPGVRAETAPATPEAATWSGWGTALKPASEPIVLARKPLSGTVVANVLAHGTGGLNVDACRTAHDEPVGKPSSGMAGKRAGIMGATVERHRETTAANTSGRWPTNVLLSHGEDCADECVPGCPVAELDAQSGTLKSGGTPPRRGPDQSRTVLGAFAGQGPVPQDVSPNQGGASRFFPVFRYQAKAPTSERPKVDGIAHSTVKPLALMRWLVRLLTPPGGTVLEPFAGSGTTIEAAMLEGFPVIGVEREADYLPLIEHRIARARSTLSDAAEQASVATDGLFDIPA